MPDLPPSDAMPRLPLLAHAGRLRRLLALLTLIWGTWLGPAPPRDVTSLLVYDFELGLPPAEAVDHLRSLGFDGVVTTCRRPADLDRLEAYARAASGHPGFQVLAYVHYDFHDAASAGVWRDALPTLAALRAPLWVIVANAPSVAATDALLLSMARSSRLHGVRTLVYPHWDTSIESAADAAAHIARVGHPNLGGSFHTCHEIRAGHQDRLGAELLAHLGDVGLVTIAGADRDAYAGPPLPGGPPWSDAIQPLDRSEFDLVPFLAVLNASGYRGPVVLHTYGITGEPGHRRRSRELYARIRASLP